MKVVFLGTGTSQGVPMPGCQCNVCTSPDIRDKRLRPSVMVSINGVNILIDAGPDLRIQMMRTTTDIHAVLITHCHRDHVAGLDELRAVNFIHKRKVPVYADVGTANEIRRVFAYCFEEEKYPGTPELTLHEFTNAPFEIEGSGGITVIPILCYHHKMPVSCFRIGDFTYITDASFIPDEEKNKIKGSKVLVINALRK